MSETTPQRTRTRARARTRGRNRKEKREERQNKFLSFRTFGGDAFPNQSSANTPLVLKSDAPKKVLSRVKSQYGTVTAGLMACRDCSYMSVRAMWDVTKPAPWCQWSQSFVPPFGGAGGGEAAGGDAHCKRGSPQTSRVGNLEHQQSLLPSVATQLPVAVFPGPVSLSEISETSLVFPSPVRKGLTRLTFIFMPAPR